MPTELPKKTSDLPPLSELNNSATGKRIFDKTGKFNLEGTCEIRSVPRELRPKKIRVNFNEVKFEEGSSREKTSEKGPTDK